MMSEVKNSHAKKVYTDAFNQLTKPKVDWPEFFTPDMKRNLLTHHLNYWEQEEDFRKCVTLQNKIDEINGNRLSNKRNK